MSRVQAKFYTTSITRIPFTDASTGKEGERATIQLQAVKDDLFGPATPDGTIRITLANEAAAAVFHRTKMGEEFRVTFEPMSEVAEVPLQTPGQSVHASGSSHVSGVNQSIRHR